MHRVPIKPLSVNDSYKGRHFPTAELTAYKAELAYRLPKLHLPPSPLAVRYVFGLSSKLADGDNFIKALQDALCRQYGFNDRDIYHWEVEKRMVPKGEEYVAFEITGYLPPVDGQNT